MSQPSTVQDRKFEAKLLRQALLNQLTAGRSSLGLSQAELGERIGANRMTIQRSEAEGADMRLSTFTEQALALGMVPTLRQAGGSGASYDANPGDIVHRGLSYIRTKHDLEYRDREREKALAQAWEGANADNPGLPPLMQTLIPGHTQAQATAAATAIQWLGSEMGFPFLVKALADAGYDVVDTRAPKAKARR